MKEHIIKPIGIIHTDFREKFGIPRQSGRIKTACGKIELFEPYNNKSSLSGLENFSHIWLIFDFSLSHSDKLSTTARPPRLGGNKRVGIFACRSPYRPNNLGLSSVKIERINSDFTIDVSGVDILDNTPIYDIKPYIPYTDIHKDAVGGFAEENKNHRLKITVGEEKLDIIPSEKRQTAIDCLCDDPRPAYQNDSNRIYHMAFASFDIHFKVYVTDIEIIAVDTI